MSSLANIITGHRNNILRGDEAIELLAAERLAICGKCSAMREQKAMGKVCSRRVKIVHKETTRIVSGCGCPLNQKTRVRGEECPAGKWKAVFDEDVL